MGQMVLAPSLFRVDWMDLATLHRGHSEKGGTIQALDCYPDTNRRPPFHPLKSGAYVTNFVQITQ